MTSYKCFNLSPLQRGSLYGSPQFPKHLNTGRLSVRHTGHRGPSVYGLLYNSGPVFEQWLKNQTNVSSIWIEKCLKSWQIFVVFNCLLKIRISNDWTHFYYLNTKLAGNYNPKCITWQRKQAYHLLQSLCDVINELPFFGFFTCLRF